MVVTGLLIMATCRVLDGHSHLPDDAAAVGCDSLIVASLCQSWMLNGGTGWVAFCGPTLWFDSMFVLLLKIVTVCLDADGDCGGLFTPVTTIPHH